MRELGTVKWFRTDLRYGYLSRAKGGDLHIDMNDVQCSPSLLKTGETVLFEIETKKGKDSAQNVTLFKLENDLSELKRWADAPETYIWKTVLPHYLEKLSRSEAVDYIFEKLQLVSATSEYSILISLLTDEEFLSHFDLVKSLASPDEITKRYASLLSNHSADALPDDFHLLFIEAFRNNPYLIQPLNLLPLSLYRDWEELRKAIPNVHKGPLLIELLKTYDARHPQWIQELVESIKLPLGAIDWDTVPDETLLDDRIFKMAPAERKIVRLHNTEFSKENSQIAAKWLYSQKYYSDKQNYVNRLPNSYKKHKPFSTYLDTDELVDVLWEDFLHSPIETWAKLANEVKVMVINRFLKENILPGQLEELGQLEKEPQIKALLLLAWAKDKPEEKKKGAFKRAHQYIQDDLLQQAVSSSKKLNIWCGLPDCHYSALSKVPYCEGRQTREDYDFASTVCPRAHICEYTLSEKEEKGAHTDANLNFHWKNWTLLEILSACGITPSLEELEKPEQYVNRLSGWVNRLEEIRDRLKCSKCFQMMVNNFKYSRNIARYSSTIVSCLEGHPHDTNIYLNHCWCCHKIIDSRESRARVDGIYLCSHCGAGPWKSQTYKVGDICPKESKDERHQRPMKHEGNGKYRCLTCNHVIQKIYK
ncbi:cold shock domain-containing protein [Neobacillus sp. Marseille-QA0830]